MQQAISRSRDHGGWLVNYDARGAVRNYHFLQQLSACPDVVPRIWKSRDCAAIVVSTIPLENIPEPHVMAWRDSFYEISPHALFDEVREKTFQRHLPEPVPRDTSGK